MYYWGAEPKGLVSLEHLERTLYRMLDRNGSDHESDRGAVKVLQVFQRLSKLFENLGNSILDGHTPLSMVIL